MAPKKRTPAPPSEAKLRAEMRRAEMELALTETKYTTGLLTQLMASERRLQEAQFVFAEPDEGNWESITTGGPQTTQKALSELRDAATTRKQMYRFWRLNPHARGILRNFTRFIVGSGFGLDFDDEARGKWSDQAHTAIKITNSQDESPAVAVVWEDFERRNKFKQRRKEIVLRTFRDGECFLRKFVKNGKVSIRFVEPERVLNPTSASISKGQVKAGDLLDDPEDEQAGQETRIAAGIEYLADDIETTVAYHVQTAAAGPDTASTFERVPASQMLHIKAFADSNDLRGIPVLEVVAKRLTNYDQWEEYRMILNKMRTAIALVRKVTGTSTQAEAIIRGRMSPRQEPHRLEPQTGSGRREAMFKPGTTLTPSPGVEYQFISPNLEARDASEDGRRFLMSIAAGVGLPEMLVTGDWSNSNFASSVEARTPAVREWEDWQEFFEDAFQTIVRWVIDAAVEDLGLPEDTSREVTIQWPPLIAKNAFQETTRLMNLWASGLLSKTTWSALEDLVYDDEQENIRDEQDEQVATQQVDVATIPGSPSSKTAGPKNPRKPEDGTVPPITTLKRGTPPGNGTVGSAARTAAEAAGVGDYYDTLATLQEEIDAIEDPVLQAAMARYMGAANRALIAGTRRSHATPPARPHRLARPRR